MTHPIIGPLADEIAQVNAVIPSAIMLINGISARIEAARQEALALGASEAELNPFVTLEAELESNRTGLAAAVEANTPSARPR